MGLFYVLKVCGLKILQKKTCQASFNARKSLVSTKGQWEKNEGL
jgi:hypothetical protein